MDELRTTLNAVLDTVYRELAAAREAGALLREVEKERDDLKRRNESFANINEVWAYVAAGVSVACLIIGMALGWAVCH